MLPWQHANWSQNKSCQLAPQCIVTKKQGMIIKVSAAPCWINRFKCRHILNNTPSRVSPLCATNHSFNLFHPNHFLCTSCDSISIIVSQFTTKGIYLPLVNQTLTVDSLLLSPTNRGSQSGFTQWFIRCRSMHWKSICFGEPGHKCEIMVTFTNKQKKTIGVYSMVWKIYC